MARKQGSHSQITGPKVHDTALRLIARHGYAAVSMRQIAAGVGVQAGALYNYTPDKQSLLYDLMRGHMADVLAALDDARIHGDPVARLDGFTRFHIRFHLTRPDHVFVSYMELRNLAPDNFAILETMRRQYETALEEILRAGVAGGVFLVPDTRIATMAIIAMLTGLSHWYRNDGRLGMDAIEDIYCTLVQKSVSR